MVALRTVHRPRRDASLPRWRAKLGPQLVRAGDRQAAGEIPAHIRCGRAVDQPAAGQQRDHRALAAVAVADGDYPAGPTMAISAGPDSKASATARPEPAARGNLGAMAGSGPSAAAAASACRADPVSAE